jgi:hypothetical protein
MLQTCFEPRLSIRPFALSLSKGSQGFDRPVLSHVEGLSPNGDFPNEQFGLNPGARIGAMHKNSADTANCALPLTKLAYRGSKRGNQRIR